MSGQTMKAAVRHEYGPPEVLHLEEVLKPTPDDDEVLIRVHAASVNLGDWELLTADPLYITVLATLFVRKPRHDVVSSSSRGAAAPSGWRIFQPKCQILGCDVAGRVEALGRKVTQFRPGDEVFGDCAIGGFGAFAEYVCVPERAALVPKPPGMSFEQAAAIPQASFIALQGLRDYAKVQPGQKVLINGAGGGAGTFAVQIARAYGAEVTAVDGPVKLDMLRSIGADHVIDYTREDFTRTGQQYDVILDMAAYRSIFESRRSLTPNGIYLMAGGSGTALCQAAFLGPFISRTGRGRVKLLLADAKRDDLAVMTSFFASGQVVPVIDGCFPLGEAAAALRRVGEKQSRGKVVISAMAGH
jgi:NADPH:quinone reductase-like Zn-dependent oxidoreductase